MSEKKPIFQGQTLIVATQHHKERAIAPAFENTLGMRIAVPSDFDTDQFGTFSGEKQRLGTPLEAARQKCRAAFDVMEGEYCVANEGSFGPHPGLFFVPADEEWLLFTNRAASMEIFVRVLRAETNFAGEYVASEDQLLDFAGRVGFPSHGLILRASPSQASPMFKGIVEKTELVYHFQTIRQLHTAVWVETDMRACVNPTRMNVIAEAAQKLVERIATCCPACNAPGFGQVDIRSGLPCALCGAPTKAPLLEIHRCQQCSFTQELPFPNGKQKEDPAFCDYCNP